VIKLCIILIVLAACINGPTPKLVPIPPQSESEIVWSHELPERISHADGFIVGKIVTLEEDWAYDDPCGLISIAMKHCDGTVTYRLKVENDLRDKWLWTFTPANGTFGLHEGEQAIFIWSNVVAYKYQKCREQQGMTSGFCDYDILPALTSDLDVLPLADSTRVDSIFQHKRK